MQHIGTSVPKHTAWHEERTKTCPITIDEIRVGMVQIAD